MPDRHLTSDGFVDEIHDLLPHGAFSIDTRRLDTRTVVVAHCRCGRKLDMLDSLPGDLLLRWLADHDDEMFLTGEQLRAKHEARLAFPTGQTASERMAAILDAYEIPALDWLTPHAERMQRFADSVKLVEPRERVINRDAIDASWPGEPSGFVADYARAAVMGTMPSPTGSGLQYRLGAGD